MIHTITASTGKFKFTITIQSKVTRLSGNSAIGKSTLVKILNQKTTKINSTLELVQLPNNFVNGPESYLAVSNDRNILFYGDEDLDYLGSEEFQRAVNSSRAFFLLVTRKPLYFIPHSYQDIYTLVSIGKTYETKRMYSDFGTTSVSYSKVECVCTEDSTSGHQFFKSFCPVVITSANGKDNIPALLETLKDCLFIVDGIGFGGTIDKISSALTLNRSNQLLCIDSFEIMVLKSEFMNAWEEPAPSCPNIEKYGTALLVSTLKDLGQSYSKSECPKCFIQNCCYSYSKCKLYKRGNKQQMIAGEIYDGLMSISSQATSHFSDGKSDKEIAQEITNADSASIVGLASGFSASFRAEHPSIDFNNPLSIQMHCQMLLELNQI